LENSLLSLLSLLPLALRGEREGCLSFSLLFLAILGYSTLRYAFSYVFFLKLPLTMLSKLHSSALFSLLRIFTIFPYSSSPNTSRKAE
jgi:hypothetical protein